ncbi:FAD binding domain-containing protein [Cytobacillus sp. Sa5YUA1]|uniref:FAD binding domain-containing protein n=1 Tax=Cytobacillus stercorigallinarum TaxID=2762240 RepID=A0ABR8QU04_9BACI|nr:FAD binding domain-containing protein [Cytobacillus stercorigallinarum]MBD7939011.1 FAD binding domain-containing protein [Cytobacillus stercorigallinarum]
MRILETTVSSPTTIDEAWTMWKSYEEPITFIAGGTFLQTKWEKGVAVPSKMLHLGDVLEYKQIYMDTERQIHIGSFVKLAECKNHPLIAKTLPQLSQTIEKIAAPAVRNLGTIGGNIANCVGDTIPLLLALDAEILYLNKEGRQRIDLQDWFEITECSIILEVIITLDDEEKSYLFTKKIGRREAFSASVVTLAGKLTVKGNQLCKVRIAAGGGETQPSRLRNVENILQHDQIIDSNVLKRVYQALMTEYQPVEDVFYSSNYRLKVASNLLISELEKWRGEYGGLYK